MATIECKLAMCISRLVELELLLELKIELKHGTSLHTPCYKDVSPSVRGKRVCPSQLYWENIEHSYTRNWPDAVVGMLYISGKNTTVSETLVLGI
jgi:hypothetical protein